MSVFRQLGKDNLHHAYLIEGAREEILNDLFGFLEEAGVATRANSDFMHISVDSFKMEDARSLKSYQQEKGFSLNKKIFVISANAILLEAQNTLLKVFEEPIPNTHFFVIVPDTNLLIKTLLSRFYVIRQPAQGQSQDSSAEKFLKMQPAKRIEVIKDMLAEPEDEEENVLSDSARTKALAFLNALEQALHQMLPAQKLPLKSFEHFFKVRQILRMPGSSVKNLLESVALTVPVLQ